MRQTKSLSKRSSPHLPLSPLLLSPPGDGVIPAFILHSSRLPLLSGDGHSIGQSHQSEQKGQTQGPGRESWALKPGIAMFSSVRRGLLKLLKEGVWSYCDAGASRRLQRG